LGWSVHQSGESKRERGIVEDPFLGPSHQITWMRRHTEMLAETSTIETIETDISTPVESRSSASTAHETSTVGGVGRGSIRLNGSLLRVSR
jgi:hypothetical protein